MKRDQPWVMPEYQRNAMQWLPTDGSWRTHPGSFSKALKDLMFYRPRLVEREDRTVEGRDYPISHWRLTRAGMTRIARMALDLGRENPPDRKKAS